MNDDTTTTRVFLHRRPPAPPRKDLPLPGVVLLVVVAVCIGILLGYVDTWLGTGGGREQPTIAEDGPPTTGKADLLTPVSLDDPETTRRLIFRLFLDRLDRSPTREEVRELIGLRLDELWMRVDSWVLSSPPVTRADLPALFTRLLGRAPEAGEIDDLLRLARNDPRYFLFHLTTSQAYAAPSARKPKSEPQLARSLYVDVLDDPPGDQAVTNLIAALKAPDAGLEQVVDLLLETATTGPSSGVPPDTWCRETFARFLLRFPSSGEQALAIEQIGSGADGWKRVLRDLVLRPEYGEY